MTPERHRKISKLFLEVCDLPADEVEGVLNASCGEDSDLRQQVQVLLRQDQLPGFEGDVDSAGVASGDFYEEQEQSSEDADTNPVIPPRRPIIPDFELLELIGQGGVSQVWRAREKSTQQEIAIKVHNLTAFSSVDGLTRFEREIKLAASLNHRHIATIYDSGHHGDIYYYTLQLIEGSRLDHYVKEHSLSDEAILRLFSIICDAVEHAHGKSIIHRDLKPSNILVAANGHPYVLDFGLAKAMEGVMKEASLTMEGDILGTLEFMAPEQALGDQQQVGKTTDIYSLGLILYRLLTGHSPIDTEGTRYALLKRMQSGKVDPPQLYRDDLDPKIAEIVMKALERKPEDRYSSAGAMNADLRDVIRNLRFS
ncbi:MAG TPA: serine/threonine protein kinase [Nitrospirales bacterium]|nr:serine/threonine protein kinase [Nitrospirales bacterium]